MSMNKDNGKSLSFSVRNFAVTCPLALLVADASVISSRLIRFIESLD